MCLADARRITRRSHKRVRHPITVTLAARRACTLVAPVCVSPLKQRNGNGVQFFLCDSANDFLSSSAAAAWHCAIRPKCMQCAIQCPLTNESLPCYGYAGTVKVSCKRAPRVQHARDLRSRCIDARGPAHKWSVAAVLLPITRAQLMRETM